LPAHQNIRRATISSMFREPQYLNIDAREASISVGLSYVADGREGFGRRKAGKGFGYYRADGAHISDRKILARIKALAIPPAWTDVWICPSATGHIQATGRDERGRKQYRYHARFREIRESTKYDRLRTFGKVLPKIRNKVKEHMALAGLPREKVIATVVHLLETTLIRVGNDDYARQNKSYGLTTLKNRHVEVNGSQIKFKFTGKSGKQWSLTVRDRRVAKTIKSCQELPGQDLIQYVDDEQVVRNVSSTDVNAYLREISKLDITAKDFRTWAGTVLAAIALDEYKTFDSQAEAKRNIREAIERVAARLGNTTTICRKCYVHPDVIGLYLDGKLQLEIRTKVERELRENVAALQPEEAAVLALLRNRLKSEPNSLPRAA
jgi:DNA topoisomerase I